MFYAHIESCYFDFLLNTNFQDDYSWCLPDVGFEGMRHKHFNEDEMIEVSYFDDSTFSHEYKYGCCFLFWNFIDCVALL